MRHKVKRNILSVLAIISVASVVKISEVFQANTHKRYDKISSFGEHLQRLVYTTAPAHVTCDRACARTFTEKCFSLPLPEYALSSYLVDYNDKRKIPCIVHSMGPLDEIGVTLHNLG